MNTLAGSATGTWRQATLGDLADFKNGINFRKSEKGDTGVPTIDVRNMYGRGISVNLSDLYRVSKRIGRDHFLQPNDVLFVRSSLKLEGIGWTSLFASSPEPVSFCGFIIRARIRDQALDPLYLTYFCRSEIARDRLIAGSGKVAITNISQDVLAKLPIPLPPLDEQQIIGAVLGLVQQAIEQQERLIAVTSELKNALMRRLFGQGLNSGPQRQTEVGRVPETWDVVALRECAVVQTGVAKGRRLDGKETVTLPYLRVANVQSGFLDLTEMKTITIVPREKSRFLLHYGDIVLTEGGDFDKLGRGFIWRGEINECLHQNHIFAVRVDCRRLLPAFFAHLSQSPYGKAYFLSVAHKTTNLACINTSKLKAFPVLVPPLDEQAEIVEILETVDAKLARHQGKRNALTELFRTLLYQLMTAQLSVRDLDLSELDAKE